jgi:hypothetical protein
VPERVGADEALALVRLGEPLVDGCDLGRAVDVVELRIAVAPARQNQLAVLLEDLERSGVQPLGVVSAAIRELAGREDLDPVGVTMRPDRPNPPQHRLELCRVAGEAPVLSAASLQPKDDEASSPAAWSASASSARNAASPIRRWFRTA